MNASKNIEIHVDCDFISKEIYMIVVESLLKYILYQFQQVPLHIDVLERELNKSSTPDESSSPEPRKPVPSLLLRNAKDEYEHASADTPKEEEMNPRNYLKEKALQRKADNAYRMHERKKGIWLEKLDKFLKNFYSTMKVLQKEINSGVVRSIVYVAGTTPFTPKFVFKIHVPSNPTSPYFHINSSSTEPLAKRKILTYLLRAFTNNADMINFTSSKVSLTKLWTLFEKENSHGNETAEFSPENLILRPDFAVGPRTKLIEVFLRENVVLMDMELTPCVGAIHRIDNGFLRPSQRKRRKPSDNRDSFSFNSCINEAVEDVELGVKPLDDISCDNETVPATPCIQIRLNGGEQGLKLVPPPVFPQTPINAKTRVDNKIHKTPSVSQSVLMIETPVVSSRSLVFETPAALKNSTTLVHSNNKKNYSPNVLSDKRTSWYQVDFPLCGFKDVYWSS